MRSALNENPMVQMGVLAVVGIVFAFIMFTSVLKKDDASGEGEVVVQQPTAADGSVAPATDAAAAPPATADPATAVPTDPAAVAPTDTGTVTPPPATGTGASDGLLPSKGLPKDVLVAYAKGDAIALVVTDPKVKGSKKLEKSVQAYDKGDVKAFAVDVNDIADYSRITEGVAVSRTPALIVIKSRKLSEGAPMATVTYGFRSPQSARQAIDDAFYDSGNVPAYPYRPPCSKPRCEKSRNK